MNVLVINSGSSSVKADVVDSETRRRALKVRVERVGSLDIGIEVDGERVDPPTDGTDHDAAIERVLQLVAQRVQAPIEAVGHRVVHGGQRFTQPTRVTPEVEAAIQQNLDYLGSAPGWLVANLACADPEDVDVDGDGWSGCGDDRVHDGTDDHVCLHAQRLGQSICRHGMAIHVCVMTRFSRKTSFRVLLTDQPV